MNTKEALRDLDETLGFYISNEGLTSFSSSFMSQSIISDDENTLEEDLDDLKYHLMFNFKRSYSLSIKEKIELERIIDEKVSLLI